MNMNMDASSLELQEEKNLLVFRVKEKLKIYKKRRQKFTFNVSIKVYYLYERKQRLTARVYAATH